MNSFTNHRAEGISLYGRYSLNRKVHLLDIPHNESCEALTQQNVDFEGRVGIIMPITTLRPDDNCGSPSRYSVAAFEPVWEYGPVHLDLVSDADLIRSIDCEVRASSALKSLSKKAQGVIPGDEFSPTDELSPKVYSFRNSNVSGFLVSYEGGYHGPRVVVLDGVPYALTGWCSFPFVRAFILNGVFYLESGSACCGCGMAAMEIFQVTSAGVRTVHADSSESD
jgi:hypothetical protein